MERNLGLSYVGGKGRHSSGHGYVPHRAKFEQRDASPPYHTFDKKSRYSPPRDHRDRRHQDEFDAYDRDLDPYADDSRPHSSHADAVAREGADGYDVDMEVKFEDFRSWVEDQLSSLEGRSNRQGHALDTVYGIIGRHEELMSRQTFKIEALLQGKGKGKGRQGGFPEINSAHKALHALHSQVLANTNVVSIVNIPKTILVTVKNDHEKKVTMDAVRSMVGDDRILVADFVPPGRQSLNAMASAIQREFLKYMTSLGMKQGPKGLSSYKFMFPRGLDRSAITLLAAGTIVLTGEKCTQEYSVYRIKIVKEAILDGMRFRSECLLSAMDEAFSSMQFLPWDVKADELSGPLQPHPTFKPNAGKGNGR